jgi:hypothetical protein
MILNLIRSCGTVSKARFTGRQVLKGSALALEDVPNVSVVDGPGVNLVSD